jgi:cysteine-rich repeat protein
VWLNAAVQIVVVTSGSAVVTATCPDARYLVDTPQLSWLRAFELKGGRLEPVTACAHASLAPRVRHTRRVRAVLAGCPKLPGRARLAVALAESCGIVTGTLLTPRGHPRMVHVSARPSTCGDRRLDPDLEACDPPYGCRDGFRCNNECRCVPPATTSTTVSTTSTTTLAVTTTTVPTSQCGNNVWEPGEHCDGADPGRLNGDPTARALMCEDFGFAEGGALTCSSSCLSWNFNGCYVCGNGKLEPGEECDIGDLGGHTCPEGSYDPNEIQCTSRDGFCRVDYSQCRRCGDGRANGNEECDDGNNVDHDGCSSTCKLECGDGTTGAAFEQCDDGNQTSGDGCSRFCTIEHPYRGGTADDTVTINGVAAPSTTVDGCGALIGISGVVNGPAVVCNDGAFCDKDELAEQCTFEYFVCFGGSFVATCSAIGWLEQVSLDESSVTGPAALSADDQTAFLDLANRALAESGVSVTTDGLTVTVTQPNFYVDLCAAAELTVPVGQMRVLAFTTTTEGFCTAGSRATELCHTNDDCLGAPCSGGSHDEDSITFTCEP